MLGATLLPLCLRPKVLVVAEEAEESSEVGGWEVEIRLAIVTPDLETTGVSEQWTLWTGDLISAEKLIHYNQDCSLV